MPYCSFDFVAAAILAFIFLFILGYALVDRSRPKGRRVRKAKVREWVFTPAYKRAGLRGEEAAVRAIGHILRESDRLLTNVRIAYDGKPAELDTVIVNPFGVFIIEVKNYAGHIVGGEDDYEWQKLKTTDAGNTYEKKVKNPVRQVRRQIYILAHHLDSCGLRVWVKGYAILLQNNSPVDSEYILHSVADIDRVIHTRDRTILSGDTVERIVELLSCQK